MYYAAHECMCISYLAEAVTDNWEIVISHVHICPECQN